MDSPERVRIQHRFSLRAEACPHELFDLLPRAPDGFVSRGLMLRWRGFHQGGEIVCSFDDLGF